MMGVSVMLSISSLCVLQCARHRTVACVGVGSGQHMDDDACSAEEMPESRSPCGYDD